MILRSLVFVFGLFVCVAAHASPADYSTLMKEDAENASDSAFTGRYEGSIIVGQTFKVFQELSLPAGPADPKSKSFTKTVNQKGKVLRSLYVSPEERSSLEVFGNYVDALKAQGFITAFECADVACGANFKDLKYGSRNEATYVVSDNANSRRTALSKAMFSKVINPRYMLLQKGDAGNLTYIAVFAAQNMGGSFGDISKALRSRVGVLIEIVEPGTREEKIVTLSADDIGNSIGAGGRVVIYGLYFDFNEAAIKTESEPQLMEMVAFLKSSTAKRNFVVGHTDNKGEVEYNVKLSTARANAVMAALVAAGVNSKRLLAKGLGPFAPLASNTTEEGQAKNRRVELVAE